MYLVTAYRWGYLNGHQYYVYCGLDKDKAVELADKEADDRGGKYGCAVWEFNAEGEDYVLVHHAPSTYREVRPIHNDRLDMFERLGHVLYNFSRGNVSLPDPNSPVKGAMKPVKVDPPQWVIDEVKRAEEFAEGMAKARAAAITNKGESS